MSEGEEISKVYVVCVKKRDFHSDQSVLSKCRTCFEEVWIMPFNLLKIPICLGCVKKIQDKTFFIDKENFDAAVEELRKLNENR